MIVTSRRRKQVEIIIGNFLDFVRSSKFLQGLLKERRDSTIHIPAIGKLETIIARSFIKRFEVHQGITMNQGDVDMLFRGALNLFVLKNLDYFYYPLNSTNKRLDLPVSLLLDLMKWLDINTRKLTLSQNQQYNKYWLPIKEEFNIHGLITAVNEMVDDFFIMTLEDLQFTKGENKILITENRLKKKVVDVISRREIDDTTFYNAVEEFKRPNLIVAFCTPTNTVIRDLLREKYGFIVNEGNTSNVLYKIVKSKESYSEIKKEFLDLEKNIKEDTILENFKKSVKSYSVQLFLVHSNDHRIISDYYSQDKLKIFRESIKEKGERLVTTILDLMDQINFLSAYFGEGRDEHEIQSRIASFKQSNDRPFRVRDLLDLDQNSLMTIFNIDEELSINLREELELIAAFREDRAKIIIPIPEQVRTEFRDKKLNEISEKIDRTFRENGIEIPDKFVQILQRLYEYKINIEQHDWNRTMQFTDEVKHFHPHVKMYLERESIEHWTSESENTGRIEHVVDNEVVLEYKLIRGNEPSKTIDSLYYEHFGQTNSEFVSTRANVGFLVAIDVHDQGNQSLSDISNYFKPFIIKGGKNVPSNDDISPRGVVVVLIHGGSRSTHSHITTV